MVASDRQPDANRLTVADPSCPPHRPKRLASSSRRFYQKWFPRLIIWSAVLLSMGLVLLMSGCQGKTPRTGAEYMARGERRMEAHDREGALVDLTRALELGEIRAAGPRARLLLALGRDQEALEDLDRMIAVRPNEAVWYTLRARAHLELGRYDQAVADADRAIRFDPTDPTALVLRARALEARGRPEQALKDLDEALKLRPNPETFVLQGDVRLEVGDLEGARSAYSKAKATGAEAAGLRGLAKVFIAEGRYGEAVENASQAVRRQPAEPENHAVLARALELAGRQSDARKAWDQGAESAPDAACIRAGRAPFALLTGDAHVAREDLNTLLSRPAYAPEAMVWLLLVDLDQGATRDELARSAKAFLERGGGGSKVAPILRYLAGEIDAGSLLDPPPPGWDDTLAWQSLAAFVAGYVAYHDGDREEARRWLERAVSFRRRLTDAYWAAHTLLERLSRP